MVDPVREAVELEMAYAWDCLPLGILGVDGALLRDYLQHVAGQRLERIGLPGQYGSDNPFRWIRETSDLGKERTSSISVSPNTNRPAHCCGIDPHTRQLGA